MVHFFDITKFNLYKEDNRREVKKANGGLGLKKAPAAIKC